MASNTQTNTSALKEVGLLTPAEDYHALIERDVTDLDADREDEKPDIFDTISKQMRNVIEQILFAENPDVHKATTALIAYREEACFYNPYDYNDWIRDIKTKLIERKMFDFWRNVIVKDKLGLLWARDCDFFDDIEDEEPAKFYELNAASAGGANPTNTKSNDSAKPASNLMPACGSPSKSASAASRTIKEIGFGTPALDYHTLIEKEVTDLEADREDEKPDIFDSISKQMRTVIEALLFSSDKVDLQKAAEALIAYREEACFYNPYEYNDWIKEIKAKLVEAKMFNFWQNVIVKDKLGLLCARDCDFFDDMDDDEPAEFYKCSAAAAAATK